MIKFSKFYYPVMFVALIGLTICGFAETIRGSSYPILHHIAVLLNGATWPLLIIDYTSDKR